MKALLIGPGAEGIALATALWRAGWELDILARARVAPCLREHGISRSGALGDVSVPPGAFGVLTDITGGCGPYGVVAVTTKAYHAAEVAQQLAAARVVTSEAAIVLFMNGMGPTDHFRGRFADRRLALARVLTGFEKRSETHSVVTVHGRPVLLGWVDAALAADLDPLASALSAGGIPAETTADIWPDLWEKMVYNCAVNGPGAIYAKTLSQLLAVTAARDLVENIISETFEVMASCGARTAFPSCAAYLAHFHARLVPVTGNHPSSLWQDLRAGRRTEIDYLNGAIVRMGRAHNVATAANEYVYARICTAQAERAAA